MFDVMERERVRDRLVEMSKSDPRLVAGALIGSTAADGGDRWSDLDLTFGLADNANIEDVLEDWTVRLAKEFVAVHLFDLPYLSTTYRVFLFPGNLQVDLSFTPGKTFLGKGLKRDVLFGNPQERDAPKPTSAQHIFGFAVVHLLHARACIARGRLWEAEYCIGEARNQALTLACLHRGLRTTYGRGFDDLPLETLSPFLGTLVGSLNRRELLQKLRMTVNEVLKNSVDVRELASKIEPQLREIGSSKYIPEINEGAKNVSPSGTSVDGSGL